MEMGILGYILAPGDAKHIPKKVNYKVSGIETCKFEFSTIKTHHNNIHNGILEKHQNKAHKRGVFSSKLKEPPGHTKELSRSTDKQNFVASN